MDYVETQGDYLPNGEEERLMQNMLYYTFYQKEPAKEGFSSIPEALKSILKNEHMRREIYDLLELNYKSIKSIEIPNDINFITPLTVHSVYSKEQIMAALGYFNEEKCPAFREGVKYFKDKQLDVFLLRFTSPRKTFHLLRYMKTMPLMKGYFIGNLKVRYQSKVQQVNDISIIEKEEVRLLYLLGSISKNTAIRRHLFSWEHVII